MKYYVERQFNPGIIDELKDKFIEDGGYTRDIIADELKELMIDRPRRICVLAGFAGDRIEGFFIGYIAANRDYLWLDQAWHSAEFPKWACCEALYKMSHFALAWNVKKMRAETERNALAIERMWGFKEHGVIVELEIKENQA